MGARRRAREHALQMLYQADVAGIGADETIGSYWRRETEADPSTRGFAERLVRAALESREEIDALIRSVSHHWTLERIGAVDRNVLRMAIAELRAEPGTPAAVVIDEAVEIARDFGESESHAFVNGLLEAARKRLAERDAGRVP